MKFIKSAISITAFSMLSACATKSNDVTAAVNSTKLDNGSAKHHSSSSNSSAGGTYSAAQGGASGVANSSQTNGSASYYQTRTLQQTGASSPAKNSSPSRLSPLGTWSGSDNQERVSIKFGANGSLILTNAAGANPGKWAASGNGTFRISVGGSDGDFTMIDASTASFTSGGSSVELRRN